MEEKKNDLSSLIGFALIGAILLYMMYQNQPTPDELAVEQQSKQAQIDNQSIEDSPLKIQQSPAAILAQEKAKLGEFGYSLDLDSDKDRFTTLENEVLSIKINNKGGMVSEVKLKAFVNHDSVPVYLVKDGNSQFNLNFSTSDNRTFNTTDLYFEPSLSLEENAQVLSMKLKVSERQFLEYKYILNTDDDYMLGFSIQSQGLSKVFDIRQPA